MDTEPAAESRISRILGASYGLGRREVLGLLAPVIYDELRVLTAAQLRSPLKI